MSKHHKQINIYTSNNDAKVILDHFPEAGSHARSVWYVIEEWAALKNVELDGYLHTPPVPYDIIAPIYFSIAPSRNGEKKTAYAKGWVKTLAGEPWYCEIKVASLESGCYRHRQQNPDMYPKPKKKD